MKINGLRFSSILFLLVMMFSKAVAQLPTPVIECVSVMDNGSIEVSWTLPPPPYDAFDGFRIFCQIPGDPGIVPSFEFTDITATSEILSGFGIDGQSALYDISMVTFLNGIPETSPVSDVANNMFLRVSNEGTGFGIAHLSWNRIKAGNNGVFLIYRKDNAADPFPAVPIAQTFNLAYNDTITSPYCTATDLYYRIEFSSGSCVANSSVASGSFYDDNQPADPVPTFVTINGDGRAELNWIPSSSADVVSYSIEVKEGSFYVPHASTTNTSGYTDDLINSTYQDPCSGEVIYVIKAVDGCDNSSATDVYNNLLNTIYLRAETVDSCGHKATLTWNAYKNMTPSVSQYEIFRGTDLVSLTEDPIGVVDATGEDMYSFVDNDLLDIDDYYYYVRAVNADPAFDDIRSESCRIPVLIDFQMPDEFELDNLTVVDNDYINLNINGLPADLIDRVEIYRSATDTASLELLITNDWGGTSPFIIPELSAEVDMTAYYYRMVALDECGFELARTLVSRSIYLELRDNGNGNIRLDWNAHEGWAEDEFVRYDFFRLENGVVANGFPVPTSNLYFDDETTGTEAGAVTYYVEAVRTDDGTTRPATSRSNEVLLPAEAVVKVPNAFRPGSLDVEVNREFKPSITNIEPDSYLFAIYNRWGQLVFETNDPARGWNGQFKGSEALRDIYAWVISYTDLTGIKASKRGSVMLVR